MQTHRLKLNSFPTPRWLSITPISPWTYSGFWIFWLTLLSTQKPCCLERKMNKYKAPLWAQPGKHSVFSEMYKISGFIFICVSHCTLLILNLNYWLLLILSFLSCSPKQSSSEALEDHRPLTDILLKCFLVRGCSREKGRKEWREGAGEGEKERERKGGHIHKGAIYLQGAPPLRPGSICGPALGSSGN